jgi:hypothetical protein
MGGPHVIVTKPIAIGRVRHNNCASIHGELPSAYHLYLATRPTPRPAFGVEDPVVPAHLRDADECHDVAGANPTCGASAGNYAAIGNRRATTAAAPSRVVDTSRNIAQQAKPKMERYRAVSP